MHYYLKAKNLFIGNTTTAVAGILEIKDGRIVHHLDYNASVEGEVLDAGDKLVVPGFIDAHVHLYLSALIHLGKMKAVGGPQLMRSFFKQLLFLNIMDGKSELDGMRATLVNKSYQRKKT